MKYECPFCHTQIPPAPPKPLNNVPHRVFAVVYAKAGGDYLHNASVVAEDITLAIRTFLRNRPDCRIETITDKGPALT